MGERAGRQWLLFFDADAFFEPGMLREVMRRALKPVKGRPLGLLGGCPSVERVSLSEKILVAIIPVMFNLGPVALSLRNHFLPPIPGFFHLWPREAYEKTRGYRAVWDKVLDDMEMARVVLNHGYQLKLIDPSPWMGLRMYRSAREVWWGLHKSVGYLMFKNMLLALFSGLGIFWAGVIPWLAPLVWLWRGWGAETWVALGALGLSVLFRALDWLRNGGPLWAIPFQPLLGAFLAAVLVHATWSLSSGRGVVWKNRRYDHRDEPEAPGGTPVAASAMLSRLDAVEVPRQGRDARAVDAT
jgi:cellulose synthase/poly-beta-1,6-N-acetylglucosamine synthase-like glycosyltransferase